MWCVPEITPEFIERMEEVLTFYEKPYDPKEPVICFDEKSKQLLKDTKKTKQTQEGKPRKRDYEYERNGTKNIFVTVEPKGGYRSVSVTERRTREDFAKEIERIINLKRYREAKRIHIVLDNLNTHFEKSITETFSKKKSDRILGRIEFHHTPKHASWLDMAEMEIGVMEKQCTKGRVESKEALQKKISIWQKARNRKKAKINWKFTVEDAKRKFKYGQD